MGTAEVATLGAVQARLLQRDEALARARERMERERELLRGELGRLHELMELESQRVASESTLGQAVAGAPASATDVEVLAVVAPVDAAEISDPVAEPAEPLAEAQVSPASELEQEPAAGVEAPVARVPDPVSDVPVARASEPEPEPAPEPARDRYAESLRRIDLLRRLAAS